MAENESFVLRKRHRYERGFTIIDNILVQDTKQLSYRAIGVAAHLWSLPDDSTIRAADLAGKGQEGRDAIRTALGELASAGYLRWDRRQVERGRWVTFVQLSDVPEFKGAGQTGNGFPVPGVTSENAPKPGSPKPGNPTSGEPGPKTQRTTVKDPTSSDASHLRLLDSQEQDKPVTAQTLLAEYIESHGRPANAGWLARSLKQLLAQGFSDALLRSALDRCGGDPLKLSDQAHALRGAQHRPRHVIPEPAVPDDQIAEHLAAHPEKVRTRLPDVW